jgi:hypothetical protein
LVIQETVARDGFLGERGGTRTLDPMIKSYVQATAWHRRVSGY